MRHQHFAELGFGLKALSPGPVRPYPPIYAERPVVMPVDGAYGLAYAAPLRIARSRWSGRPELFDLLDLDQDKAVDEYGLAMGRCSRRAPPRSHPPMADQRGAERPDG